MSQTVLLDSGPLSMVTHPKSSGKVMQFKNWFQQLVAGGVTVIVPEITDYEVRRELLRARKTKSIQRLDILITKTEYLAITTEAMRQAAQYWANARQQGRQTADNKALDIDMILAAQATTLNRTNVVIATTNVRHLSLFTQAMLWSDIGPEIPNSSNGDLQNGSEK